MKKTLSHWLSKVSEFSATVLVIQAMLSGVGNSLVGILIAVAITALCLAWSLILADEEDAEKGPGAAAAAGKGAASGNNKGPKKKSGKKARCRKAARRRHKKH